MMARPRLPPIILLNPPDQIVLSSMLNLPSTLAAVALGACGVHAFSFYPPVPEDRTTPSGQRISLFSADTVAVAWSTYGPLDDVCVSFGKDESSLDQTVCGGTSHTIPDTRQYQHSVHLSGLAPDQKYYYKIQSSNSTVWSFKSGKTPGTGGEITVGIVTDLGLYGKGGYTLNQGLQKRDIPMIEPNMTHTTIDALANAIGGTNAEIPNGLDFIAHAGDLAYADDWLLSPEIAWEGVSSYEAVEERFYEQFAPISGRVPWQVGPGNHEAQCTEDGYHPGTCPSGYSNFTEFRGRFGLTMPSAFASTSHNETAVKLRQKAASLAIPPLWHSFDYGLVHVTMINTETDFPNAPDGLKVGNLDAGPFGYEGQQKDWLEADLASVDRSVTPWVLVGGHRPWYTTNSDAEGCHACQKAFDGILYRYGVDLVFTGHEHNSQRFLPMFNNQPDQAGYNNPKAPVYLVAGAAGNIEGLTFSYQFPDGYVWGNDQDHAFATLTVHNRTHLTSRFFRSSDGVKIDEQTLYKQHHERSVNQH